MTLFEIISLSLSLISAICVAFATWFGLRNLRLMISAHKDNHEWNRRLATQNALNELRGFNKDLLNEVFRSEDLMTSIPLTVILEEFEKRHELQNLCHTVLN